MQKPNSQNMKQFTQTLLILFLFQLNIYAQNEQAYIHFSIDACMADVSGSNEDFSEFTSFSEGCSNLSVVGNNLYRTMPEFNSHSCTPGVNSSIAMCVGADFRCNYSANNDKAIRFDIQVDPNSSGSGGLTGLSFFQKSPLYFSWINGRSGLNNPPQSFAVDVLVNGQIIYSEADLNSSPGWKEESFDFANNPAFQVTESTVFSFQITPYCPFESGGEIAIWDIDEIRIFGSSSSGTQGGTISGGPYTFCVGDNEADNIPVNDISLSGNVGANSQWVVTDATGMTILGLPSNPSDVDFDGAGAGTCLLWHLSYDGPLSGAEVDDPVSGLEGCFSLSNSIAVTRIIAGEACQQTCVVDGGTLSGGPFSFCVGDSIADNIPAGAITLSNQVGENSQWVVTDITGITILGLPPSPEAVNFDSAGPGTCLIWHLSYDGELAGAIVDGPVSGLGGCFSLSNSIEVIRNQPNGGTLIGGPFTFCAGDGIADNLGSDDIVLTGHSGSNSQWVVTDESGTTILGLPPSPVAVNFEESGAGTCLIWHLSYYGELSGATVNGPVSALSGCFSLSNSVTVIRSEPNGGTLSGGPYSFCVGDGIPDNIPLRRFELTGESGSNSQWLITNEDTSTILGLPDSPFAVDFDESGVGVCLLWHLSYEGELTGAEMDAPVSGLSGCFSLSNAITISRTQPEGGILSGGPFSFCVGDGIADNIMAGEITLSGIAGSNSQWVVTNADSSTIIALPNFPQQVDFDRAGVGTCLIWHMSYDTEITGDTINGPVSGITGCFSLSNPISVIRSVSGAICDAECDVNGGALTGGPFSFCVGDGVKDTIAVGAVTLADNAGANSQWVVTNADTSMILGLPSSPSVVDFEAAGVGVCLLWHLSHDGDLSGAGVDSLVSGLSGCFSLSNAITVTRTNTGDGCVVTCDVNGGTISGGPYSFCAGDGVRDTIAAGEVTIDGNTGANSQWVVTNADTSMILGLPSSPSAVDFDVAGAGVCLLWHLSHDGTLTGAGVDSLISGLSGCFSLSNAITVTRSEPAGGTISGGPFSFCVGDGVKDTIAVGAVTLVDNTGANSQWVVTNADTSMILGLPSSPSAVDFEAAGVGVCLLWHLSHDGDLSGAGVDSLVSGLSGCFSLSNAITVTRIQPDGGTLGGGPFVFCAGDGNADMIPVGDLTLTGNIGSNSQWLITNTDTTIILGLPTTPEQVDFDGAGLGNCLIWHISYEGELSGNMVNDPVSGLTGCLSLSNAIEVIRANSDIVCDAACETEGGTITGGPFSFCVGDGVKDTIAVGEVSLVGNAGANSQWVVTNADTSRILGLPGTPSEVDFDDAGAGVCLLWHLSFDGDLIGADVDSLVSGLDGCFSLSNAISVTRTQPEGGTLTGGPFSFNTVGDGTPDTIALGAITLTNNEGETGQWIVTNDQGIILGLPSLPSDVNFDETGIGTCLIWHLSYNSTISGLDMNANANDLVGCFSLSNSIEVIRSTPEPMCLANGGQIMGGPFTFCAGDGIKDSIDADAVTLSGSNGANSVWVLTDASSTTIIGLPPTPDAVDFEIAGAGTCLLWHLSFEDGLMGLTLDGPVSGLTGCFDLSNSIEVIRTDSGPACEVGCTNEGGLISGGPYTFCVGDGVKDTIALGDITLMGNDGTNSSWVVTDDDTINILDVASDPSLFDFDGSPAGTCLIWHVSFEANISGLSIEGLVAGIGGCFDLSNAITVNRVTEGDECNTGANSLSARYRVTFDGTWNEITHPADYPGGAHWSPIVGMTHNMDTTLFDAGMTASQGIENMAESGSRSPLNMEIDAMITSGNSAQRINATGGQIDNDGSVALEFDVTDNHSLVSLVSMIAPSPDWFVGLSGLELLNGQDWVESKIVQFDMYDAGTDSGLNFNSTDSNTQPKESIDNLDAGPLVDNGENSSLGIWRIERIDAGSSCNLSGGELSGGPFNFCIDDTADNIQNGEITLSNTTGSNTQWVITDDSGFIIELPDNYSDVDFNAAGVGICVIYHLSYTTGLGGLMVTGNIEDFDGCFSLSNGILVVRDDSDDACGSTAVGPIIVVNEIIPTGGLVELKNIGDESLDVSSYILCNFPDYERLDALTINCGGDYMLDAGETLTVELPTTFALDSNDGEMGLYLNTQYTNSASVIDYVEWGSTGHRRSTVAVSAGIWTTGDFVSAIAANMSLNYDGEGNAPSDWIMDTANPCDVGNLTDNSTNRVSLAVMENPVMDVLNVRLNTTNDISVITVDIRDIFGVLVKTQKFQLNVSEAYERMDVSDISQGLYFVSIRENYGLVQAKIVKN